MQGDVERKDYSSNTVEPEVHDRRIRWKPLMVKRIGIFATVCLTLVVSSPTARAELWTWSGLSSVNTPVSFEAELTITEGALTDTLTVALRNTSAATLAPDDALSSFYFDIFASPDARPVLNYSGATGTLYKGVVGTGNDIFQGTNIQSYWLFQQGLDLDPSLTPFLGYGIGAVGNNGLTPNNFPGMDGVSGSIYANEITTQNLKNAELVLHEAVFTFTGEFSNAYFGDRVAFGLGTAPDSIHIVPLPAATLLGMLGLDVAGLKLRKSV
jgi:hypothetical protein